MGEEVMRKEFDWKLDFSVTLGKAYTKFMEGLKNKKVLGNKCGKCGRVYVPPRPFCDICFEEPEEWIETNGVGRVETFTIGYQKFKNLPEPPYISAVIKIGESSTGLIHFISGINYNDPQELPNLVKVGMKVKPVWAEERRGDIFDILYFEPVEEG